MNSQGRIIEIVKFLAGQELRGAANKEIAEAFQSSPSKVSRDIDILEAAGWVEKTDGGRWRLSPSFGGLFQKIAQGFREAKLELAKEESRYLNPGK